MKYIYYTLISAAIIVGIAGRLIGGWINTQSNDDHVEVVLRINAGQDVKHKDSCWECFQPKAFYQSHAAISNLLGNESRTEINRQMQLINVLLSFIGLWFIFLSLKPYLESALSRLMVLSFLFVLPVLFGMSIQNTNDIPVFALACGAIYFLLRFQKSRSNVDAYIAILLASLAYMVKGSGLAVFLMISVIAVGLALRHRTYGLFIPLIALFIHLFLYSHYSKNYRTYGDAFVTNIWKPPPPPLFNDSIEFWARPGITSIYDGYCKTQFVDLIRHPYNVNAPNYTPHRTSFWAQLYASTFDVMFLQHPYFWQNRNDVRLMFSRLIFLLGIVPVVVLLVGLWKIIRNQLKSRFGEWNNPAFLSAMLMLGMLFFVMRYAYIFRDYGCIKAHFMVPVLLPIVIVVLKGWKTVHKKSIGKLFKVSLLVFLPLIIYNSAYLIHQLIRISNGSLTFP